MRRPTPLILRAVVLATLVPGLLAVSTVPASAESPPALDGPVTDHAGALDGGAGDVADAIARTLEDHGVQAWVLFVDSTDGEPAPDYATETARINSLGADDALVLVALEDRTDSIWVADGLDAITDAEIDAIIADELEPRLRDGDFTGAAMAAVEGLGAANDTAVAPEPTSPTAPEPAPGEEVPSEGDAGGGGALGFLLPLLFIGLIVGGVFLVIRAVQGRGAAEERDRKTGALAREANSLLISTDERIRDAAQEVDFVEAQYGDAEVDPLRQAVGQARDELKRSFEIRQKLDDAEPEDAAAREQMLREIVERLTRAHAVLDAQTERIRQLRDLERDAPETLAALPGRIDAVEGRLPAGEAALKALDRYAPSASQPVRGNVVEARKGLAGAREAVASGTASLQAGDTAKAASATRLALEGVTGATGLLDAIDRLTASFAAAQQQLPGALREAETDLADARATAAETGHEPGSPIGARLSEAERALAAARAAAAASPGDPAAALSKATEAQRLADEVLAAAREEVAARQRLEAAATASIRTAASAVDRAADFVGTRRRGVGRGARTRLAEAERNLADAEALEQTDPALAAQAAQRAERLANDAYQLADDDFNDWDQGGPGWGQRRGGSAAAATSPARSWAESSAGSCRAVARAAAAGAVPRGAAPAAAAVAGSRAGGEAAGSAREGSGVVVAGAAADVPGAGDGEARSVGPTGFDARARGLRSCLNGRCRRRSSMAQTSILGRIGQLVRANVNSLLDSAEDPEKMLDQLVRDFTNNIAEAEEAVAQTIGNLRLVEDDAKEARTASSEWGDKAAAASRRADQLRGEGNTAEADRFDELAKIALRRQLSYEGQATTLETQASQQAELAEKLKDGLNKLRAKREELVQKRDELVSRAKMAQAQEQVQVSLQSVSALDPTSEISRFEERIRRQEAMVRGREEVAASSLEEQFASLDDDEDEVEVETRLAQLKSGS